MLQEAFDGQSPSCVEGGYDDSVTFFQARGGAVRSAAGVLAELGFQEHRRGRRRGGQVDMSTDDWPFFYMPQPHIPGVLPVR